MLAIYTLAFPYVQALLGVYVLFSLMMMLVFKAPVLVAIISYLPVLMLLAHLLTSVIGLREFTEAHGLKASPRDVVRLMLAWFPYQLVAGLRRLPRGVASTPRHQQLGEDAARRRTPRPPQRRG